MMDQKAKINKWKQEIRTEVGARRDDLSFAEKKKQSHQVCNLLAQFSEIHQPKIIHSFIPFDSEVNILPFLEACLVNEIEIISPKALGKPYMTHFRVQNLADLEVNKYDIPEPVDGPEFRGQPDVILVPGIAFALTGHRIGYGGGYYDHYLSRHQKVTKIGVGFTVQLVDQVPFLDHDIPVDLLILGDKQFFISGSKS